jgi:hypothetical protein
MRSWEATRAHTFALGICVAYRFEELGDERFQQLCQAILVRTHPGAQCLPVGQPDGGRDAFLSQNFESKNGELVIFQVKFVKSPQSREARDFVEQVITTEGPKIERLIKRGATKYYLLTNVIGTSHLDVGSVDKVNARLKAAFGIAAHCWWRDDLERRIDAYPDIKWSYPDILQTTDLLLSLIREGADQDAERRSNALRSYMAYQARYDEQLKFKQIDLQKSIIDLFVDVPSRIVNPPEIHSDGGLEEFIIERYLIDKADSSSSTMELDEMGERYLVNAPGTLRLLSSSTFIQHSPRIVVEGAPGQGKSTVTQYLCQINRFRLLNRLKELSRVGRDLPTEARIPFRVDLRDYAGWLVGRDPFSDDSSAGLPAGISLVLESFLAAQIRQSTGMNFSVDDMTAVAKRSQILIVLDGFDEVADIDLRNRIVVEVSDAADRIIENAISAQIIVTSRPAAFANSPGFSRDEWRHVEILSLSRKAIMLYANKWLDGRDTEAREKREVLRVLTDKLKQPYVRDLARNPMQLAILLALISVQGASLPDKRTALYDNYIEIFLNRESEKSAVVRDHRELLVQIHRFLAWTLQVEAETNAGTGNIAENRLRDTLRAFLERGGHETKLIDRLFSGMVERVVVLVSRVQGTYEFEVQPLREYFAARYLYDTAPYAPAGVVRRGTLPERFDAIARNFYWLNVARFYAGCYNSGELASLLDGLEELQSSDQFRFISNVPRLGATLLSDYVFGQQPKLVAKLASRVTTEPHFRILLASLYLDKSRSGLSLPDGPARATLINTCKKLLVQCTQDDTCHAVSETLLANHSSDDIQEYWWGLRQTLNNDKKWLQLGRYLQVFHRLSVAKCVSILADHGETAMFELQRYDRVDVFDESPDFWRMHFGFILDGAYYGHYPARFGDRKMSDRTIAAITVASVISFLSVESDWATRRMPFRHLLRHRLGSLLGEEALSQKLAKLNEDELPVPRQFLDKVASIIEKYSLLGGSLAPWSEIVELGRNIWGEQWVFYKISIAAASTVKSATTPECGLTDETIPLCERTVHARLNSENGAWWQEQIVLAQQASELALPFTLLALHTWMPVKTVLEFSAEISVFVDSLPFTHWRKVVESADFLHNLHIRRPSRQYVALKKSDLPDAMSPRLACLLASRVTPATARQLRKRYLADYNGKDPFVLMASATIAIEEALSRANYWARALPVISYAYSHDAPPLQIMHMNDLTRSIPIAEARSICANAHLYPLFLVGYADSTLAARTGAAAIPVGKIAERDEWFVEF